MTKMESMVDMNDPDEVGNYMLFIAYAMHAKGRIPLKAYGQFAEGIAAAARARRYAGARGKLRWVQDKFLRFINYPEAV